MIKSSQILKIYGTAFQEMTKSLLKAADLAALIREKQEQTGEELCIGIKPNLVCPTPADYGATTHPEIVAGIIEYLREKCTEHLSLDDLAAHFMLSKHYLCHVFKKGTGFSVMEYVIQLRIITAQRLLRQGANVQEASERSGFQTYSHFIRTFNTYVGISPKKYAKLYRQGDHYSSESAHAKKVQSETNADTLPGLW